MFAMADSHNQQVMKMTPDHLVPLGHRPEPAGKEEDRVQWEKTSQTPVISSAQPPERSAVEQDFTAGARHHVHGWFPVPPHGSYRCTNYEPPRR